MEARRALGSGGGASVIGEVFVFAKIAETFGLKKAWREKQSLLLVLHISEKLQR